MAEYDMGHMQEEAIRRAREMQSRARFPHPPGWRPVPRQPGTPSKSEESRAPVSEPREPAPEPPAPKPSKQPAEAVEQTKADGLMENLFQDKERTIILALLVLLSGEEKNHELLFALLFLLL